LFAASPVWGINFIPGKYEITAKMVMVDMPSGMPLQITTQCPGAKDPVPSASASAGGMTMTTKLFGKRIGKRE